MAVECIRYHILGSDFLLRPAKLSNSGSVNYYQICRGKIKHRPVHQLATEHHWVAQIRDIQIATTISFRVSQTGRFSHETVAFLGLPMFWKRVFRRRFRVVWQFSIWPMGRIADLNCQSCGWFNGFYRSFFSSRIGLQPSREGGFERSAVSWCHGIHFSHPWGHCL